MKRIDKQEAPSGFERCVKNKKKKKRPINWESFSDSHPQVKQELADQLRREQGYLCCYCEQRIDEGNSHIEHLRPKGQYPEFTFQYANLLSCCCDKNSCGNKKGGWFSNDMVTPLTVNCEERFIYLANGEIKPADTNDSHAQETIDQLNLNSKKLERLRMGVFDLWLYEKEDAVNNNNSIEDFAELVREVGLSLNSNGEYAEFWTTIKYVAEKA